MKTALSDDLQIELFKIGAAMEAAGLPPAFITAAVRTAIDYEGVYDLMTMWRDETDADERAHVVADIQDMIDDTSEAAAESSVYVRFDDLEKIALDIRAFKNGLLKRVNSYGGISKLARETGIPQPSLSRFFAQASMPRRGTLQKIAEALKVSAVEIATEWTR